MRVSTFAVPIWTMHAGRGPVRGFKNEKGYGRITGDDGEVLLVHFSGIVSDGFRSLAEGDRVSFVWRGGVVDHGRHVAEASDQSRDASDGVATPMWKPSTLVPAARWRLRPSWCSSTSSSVCTSRACCVNIEALKAEASTPSTHRAR